MEENNSELEQKTRDKKLQRFSTILLVIAILLFVFGSGYRFGEHQEKKKVESTRSKVEKITAIKTDEKLDLEMFWNIFAILQERYADQGKLKPEKMLYGAIKGMVASLEDPYTYFLTPKENQKSKDDLGGKYEGIGAELGMRDNKIVVVTPLENSPAEKAGLKAGDIIIAVDGESIKGWTITQAVNNIRGPKGEIVTLTILRNEKSQKIKIKRDQIKIKSVKLSYKKEKECKKNCSQIAYLKVSQFGDTTNQEWDRAVLEVKNKWKQGEIKGLALDVRSNPGGYLEGSVYLASEFLPNQKLIVKQEYASDPTKEYRVQRAGLLLDIPMVVLINEGSASASEILAGALRDHDRAKLIGKKSFGKGSIQEALDLEDGTGLHITIAKWVLPNGDWINSKGIKPNYEVENKIQEGNTIEDDTDSQLNKAIEVLLK